jgi:hypothetical protein
MFFFSATESINTSQYRYIFLTDHLHEITGEILYIHSALFTEFKFNLFPCHTLNRPCEETVVVKPQLFNFQTEYSNLHILDFNFELIQYLSW